MVSVSILNEVLKSDEKRIVLKLENNKLWLQKKEFVSKQPDRCFTIIAKLKIFQLKKENNESDYRFYLACYQNVKLSINKKAITKPRIRIRLNDNICIDDINFSLSKGLIDNQVLPIVKAENLEIAYRGNGIPVIKKLSFEIFRGEMVALMGPSGCGKSTLLKELAGENNLKSGKITIANRPLHNYYHSEIKTKIGYVQQEDVFHPNLTVNEILFYTAKLRNIPSAKERIDTVLKQLSISHKKDDTELSGGQRKRLAIANELLDQPDILLLDEPTSPLDPEAVSEFLKTLNSLAHTYNKAIIMVTHKPGDLKYADKVIFLTKNGYQIYAGSKEGFIPYVNSKLGKPLRHPTLEENLLDIYTQASNEEFEKEFYNPGYLKPTSITHTNLYKQSYNSFNQFFWLTARYLKVKFPSKGWIKNIFLNILLPPITIGSLFFAFPNFNLTCLFLISLATIWFGVNNASKEIVEEQKIYQRERAFNLKIDPYILSKILVLSIISTFQILVLVCFVTFRFTYFNYGQYPKVTLYAPLQSFFFLSILSLASTNLGLLVSTLYNRVDKVLMLVPLALIPQIILSGLVSKPDVAKKEAISYMMLGRWGLEGLCRIQDSAAIHYSQTTRNGYILDSSNSIVIEGISPRPNNFVVYTSGNALDALGSYENNLRRDETKVWVIFNSLKGNYIVLLIHIAIMFLLCRLILLKKDTIPLHPLLNKKTINRMLSSLGVISSILFFWCIVFGKEKYAKHEYILNARAPVEKKSSNVKPKKSRKVNKKNIDSSGIFFDTITAHDENKIAPVDTLQVDTLQ